MKIKHIVYFIFFVVMGCQTNVTYIDSQKKESLNSLATNPKIKNNTTFDAELSVTSLKNTKWVFDNYSTRINLKNLKLPTIIFSEITFGDAVFSGETFINLHLGKLQLNNANKRFLIVKSYKSTSLKPENKKIEYYEQRYSNDFKKINSIKIYRNKLIFGIENSANTMIFKKV
jgi:hypothetical protein